jgi:hypothetical protein
MNGQPHTAHSKGGRPPKPGQRARIHAWVPQGLADLLRADADAEDIPLSDRLAEILATHYSRQEAMPTR